MIQSEATPLQQEAAVQPPVSVRQAKLSKVTSLHDLWSEYEFGINGNIAAKLFTPQEKRACRSQYSLRNSFWKIVKGMIARSYSAGVAVDKVYEVYGGTTGITYLLRQLAKDIREKTLHPSLMP